MNPNDHLLTAREGAALLHISVPTFWRRVADGTVPKPIKIGALSRWSQA
ncbi:helix-turn-helix transcriptional regulator, partial [Xanthobacter versatilis]